jgi:hypothetical protein
VGSDMHGYCLAMHEPLLERPILYRIRMQA